VVAEEETPLEQVRVVIPHRQLHLKEMMEVMVIVMVVLEAVVEPLQQE
tara:strand:+ start:273 stop:416 length:144 start_codon:yes stop_codon:yes gene_type:complete